MINTDTNNRMKHRERWNDEFKWVGENENIIYGTENKSLRTEMK